MPTVINGIGTWYYGKRRIHTIKGTCEFCHSNADLVSYDTTLFGVVFFVPVIPLGQKRILQQCAVCQQHRVVKLGKWQEAKERDAADLMEKLREDPDNHETLLRAVGYCLAYQDEPLFSKVADLAARRTRDSQLQAQLGAAHSYFARWADAEHAYRLALAAEDTPALREQLAWALLKQDRPDEARPYLQHVLDERIVDAAGNVYFLIKGYQAQGRHDEALALMDERDRAFPGLVGVKEYQQQRKLSTKYQGTERRVRDAFLDDKGKAGYREGNWTARVPKLIAAAIFLGLLGWYLGAATWIGQNRKVYLVNGTGQPYTVVIAGAQHELRPNAATPIRTPEGDIQVSFADAGLGLEPVQGTFESSFWSRPFVRRVFVINLDQAAVILEEETFYAQANPQMGAPPTVHFGQAFYSMSAVDYEFQEFPLTIQVSANAQVRKTRVALPSALGPETRWSLLQGLAPQEQAALCKRVLALEPGNILHLHWLSTVLGQEEMLKFVETRVDDVPILVEWHRLYQSLMERLHPETDLRPRYRKLVADTQEQSDAVYLLGRAEPDVDEAERLFQKAAKATPPSANALAALGFDALCAGRFDDARQRFEEALPLLREKYVAEKYFHDALLGAGEHDRLVQALQTQGQAPGRRTAALVQILRVHAIRRDKAAAAQTLAELTQMSPPGAHETLRQTAQSLEAVGEEDVEGFLKSVGDMPNFDAALLRGDLKQAAALTKQPGLDALANNCLLYLEATRTGAKDIAEAHWQALLSELDKSTRHERRLGEMLSGKKPLDAKLVQRLPIEPGNKRVLLAVLAQRHPEHAKEFLALARRLNFQRDAISLCLRKHLAAADK
jgi:tetratricopeptide (TPR) repeat protein